MPVPESMVSYMVNTKSNTVDIFSDRDEMKRAVWQTEGVFKNSFTRRTTRDRGHGHLKSVAGTRQAAAQIYRRAASNDPGATRTCQLPESGSLWRLLRAHLLAPVSGSVSMARVPRQNASDLSIVKTPSLFIFIHLQTSS